MIWDKESECLPRNELESLKLSRLKEMMNYVYHHVPFYQRLFNKYRIKPEIIKTLDDLKKIPYTTREDLVRDTPFDFLAVPINKVSEVHTTSGRSGRPIMTFYSENDIKTWSDVMARVLSSAGLTKEDIVHNAFDYGLFSIGLGVHYGIREIGALIVPVSTENPQRQLMILEHFSCTAVTCTPSYALHLTEIAEDIGMNFKKLKLKVGIFSAEPWSERLRKEIERELNIEAYDFYGLTEIIGPGIAGECEERKGLHLYEDYFLPEIIDPETGENLSEGESGELVLTTLYKEAFPLIRYRSGDITKFLKKDCPCGRTFVKIAPISGRTDDLILLHGKSFFPYQIENVLLEMGEIRPHYHIILDKVGRLDVLEVKVEALEEIFRSELCELEMIEKKIRENIEAALGITTKITIVEPKTIERTKGGAGKVIDKRIKK